MTWPCVFEERRIDLARAGKDRINPSDAKRQTATAREILRRLGNQPGVILADEVGMGKTFVALVVAASASWGDEGRGPVVVMVPPSLKEKWPGDFELFKDVCLTRQEDKGETGLRMGRAENGVEFLKLLDDPPKRRKHIIFVTHGTLHRGLTDRWTKLAILVKALHHRTLVDQREAFPRFAAEILRLKSTADNESLYAQLYRTHPDSWKDVLVQYGVFGREEDDPVPKAVYRLLDKERVDLANLRTTLRDLPLRHSANRDARIQDFRGMLKPVLDQIWLEALKAASFRSPLLILDEAHHLKNPATRLASLFVEDEAKAEADLLNGALQGHFERMLFLTATPFQLGHAELLNVLDRFRGIRWGNGSSGGLGLEEFAGKLKDLRKVLDEAQFSALQLEKAWRHVRAEHLGRTDIQAGLDDWWREVVAEAEHGDGTLRDVARQYHDTMRKMRAADKQLKPWVIRHLRARSLPGVDVPRRMTIPGAEILAGNPAQPQAAGGIPVEGAALLPFLLVARCQALIAGLPSARSRREAGNTTFVEGLASSFEAYRDTRKHRDGKAGDVVDEAPERTDAVPEAIEDRARLDRYVNQLDAALAGLTHQHPKVRATVRKALELWKQGEKVLIFCHFRATAEALTDHLSRAIQDHLEETAARKLGCDRREVDRRLHTISRAFDPDESAFEALEKKLEALLAPHPKLEDAEKETIKDVVRRFVRTDSFLVRYFELGEGRHAERLEAAWATADASGLTLERRIERFIEFIAGRTPSERQPFLDALEAIRTGTRGERSRREEETDAGEPVSVVKLPVVRMANGKVKQETRQRLMRAFNAPFFPEILVASSVLAEGVDLHLDCRYVIHHDLDWNPSTLEQRTGRVDRIGAKAERARSPINIFLPYIDGTQDEKMYRVVRDRERWFQVVMGESYRLTELAVDRIAERVPFPESAARSLAFQLEVWPGSEPEEAE